MPKVSVIIPTYDEEENINECLESLSKQSYKNLEIIIVDDGSTDKSKIKIQKSKSQFKIKNLMLLEQNHKGAGAARNLGAKHAKGEFLVFIDADMTFDKDFVSQLVQPIIEGKTIGTFSKEEYLANKDNIWAVCWNINRGLPKNRMHTDNYPANQKVFRAILKREFERVEGFNEKAGYTDDWSLSEKLGVEAQAAPHAVFYHKNPGTLKEVFIQSKWMAKRRYKMGNLGIFIALVRVSLPVSVPMSIYLTIRHKTLNISLFKIVSDFGQFIGILEYAFAGKVSK